MGRSASKHRVPPAAPLRSGWRLGVPGVLVAAGLLFVTSATNARGTDLRPGRYTDLPDLVASGSARVESLRREARQLQAQIDLLSEGVDSGRARRIEASVARLRPVAGLTPLGGPGLVVTLDDAPRDQPVPDGTDPDVLVVHQQDIQAVVNALWAGGAEAMTLQGQRIIATTGVKCVGNTVVLHGVPYSPPYRVGAIGDVRSLRRGLAQSDYIDTYLDYVAPPYNLGWSVQRRDSVLVPAYAGTLDLTYASPAADVD